MRVAVVTGATSGVGEYIAESMVKKGWRVFGIGRNPEKLRELNEKLGSAFIGIAADIRNFEAVKEVFARVEREAGEIDILVNNASVFKMLEYDKCSQNDIDSIIDTNLKGTMYCTLAAVGIMKTKKKGRIINIASVASTHGIPKQAIYCASKYGLNGFAEALNQELIPHNISITTIYPGGINTPLWNDKNPYPGNIDDLLKPQDIVRLVEYIVELEPYVILKNMTIFPSNEWH